MSRKPNRRPPKRAVIVPLAPDDPRGLDHPAQRPALIEFAKAIGRYVAEQEFKRQSGERGTNEGQCDGRAAHSSKLRKILD